MSQTALTIRLDSDLKKEFDALCKEFGMSTNTAFNIFVKQVIRNRCIPFIIESANRNKDDVMADGRAAFYRMRQDVAKAGLQEPTLNEINEEIRIAREATKTS